MGKVLYLCVLLSIILLIVPFAHAQVLVNNKPAEFTVFDSGNSKTYFVNAEKDDAITFVRESENEISIASMPGSMNIFSIAKVDEDLFDNEFLASENYIRDGKVPVIVTLNVTESGPESAGNLAGALSEGYSYESAKMEIMNFLGSSPSISALSSEEENVKDLKIIDAIALEVDQNEIDSLVSLDAVKKIELDRKVFVNLQDSVPLINATDVWKLFDQNGNNLTGSNVTIAIIDTGVDYTHPDLGGCLGSKCKVAGGYDFINLDSNPMDDHGHGTHVAATAAGNGTLNGVAPNATIYAYKVLSSGGSGTFSQVIAGVERATDPNNDGNYSDRLDIISMSLGGFGDENSALSVAVDRAVDRGVVAVVAAGNSGSNTGAIGTPGSAQKAITIAATDKSDNIASFSSRGPTTNKNLKPDVAAPGVNICAAEWDSAWATRRCLDTRHVSISGTSMATPHVAGLAALLLQKNKSWTPDMVKSAIVTTTKDLGQSVFAQGSGRVRALNASNAKMLAFPAVISFGKVSGTNISRLVVIKNVHNATMMFNISVTNVTDGTSSYNISATNVSSLTIEPGQNATINLSINIGNLGGTFYGYLNITSGSENYRVPFSFVRLTEVRVTVTNGTSELRPLIILLFDDKLNTYQWAFYWTFSAGTYTFTVPTGNYTAAALGDASKQDTTYILVNNASASIGSNTTIDLDLADANNFTALGTGVSNETLNLYKWQYMATFTSGLRRLSTSMTYLGASFEGNRSLYISSQKGGTNVSVSFAYIGYPKRARPSYESVYQWNDDTFTASDRLYFAAWNLSNVTNSTPNILNFSLSNLGVFNYTYNYPGYDPSINTTFDSYASIYFWISPISFFDISAWIRTAASLKRTIYVMENKFGFWHYQHMNYLKSSTLGGDWRSEFGAMVGQVEYDTMLSETWPIGTQFAAGSSREAQIGTSYTPTFFENTNTTVALNKFLLRGVTNQTYVVKSSTVTWYSSDGTSGTVYLPKPQVLIYRGSSLIANNSNWRTVSYSASAGSYMVNITLPTAYPLYNITYIEANFTLPSADTNPPGIVSLNASKFFAENGTVSVDFNITDGALSSVSASYSYDRENWTSFNVTNQSTVYNGTIRIGAGTEISLRINASDAAGNAITYRFIPIAILQRNVLINLKSDKPTANPGDTLIISGNIESESNLSQVRVEYETDGNFYQYDRSGYLLGVLGVRYTIPSNYTSATLNISAVFNGTGVYPRKHGSVIINVNVSTTAPSLSGVKVSPLLPDANDDIKFNVTATASNGIDKVLFESNFSGLWTNYTMTNVSSVYNYTMKNTSSSANMVIGYRFHANSTSGNRTSTAVSSVTVSAIATSVSAGAVKSNVNTNENNTLFCDYTENGNGDVLNATVLADISGNNTMTYNTSSGRYEANYSSSSTGTKAWTCYASKGNFSSASAQHSFSVTETTAPSFGNVTSVGTVYNTQNITVSAIWTDNTGLDVILFSSNFTGSWANYTIRANATTYNASYNITNMSNGQVIGWRYIANDTSGNINNLMPVQTFTVQNREPSIVMDRNDNNKGFGEGWNFTLNLSDSDGDTLNVSFYATPPNGTMQFISSITTTNSSVLFTKAFNKSFIGQTEINFTVNDSRSSNSTALFNITVEKDDATVNITLGINGTVQRFGYNTVTLGMAVFDTDKGEYVNSTARILWTKDGFTPYDDFEDCSVVNGNCSVTLDPDHFFSIGEQNFMGSILDNNSFYKAVNSSQASFIVNGTLFTSVNGPSGQHNFNSTILFNTTVTDDTSSVREVDEVFLEYKFSNAVHWRSCTPVNASANGEYTCPLNALSLPLGSHDIRYTAQKENYTSFNTTVLHQFFVIKFMAHREKINLTSFSTSTVRPENINTTIDIIPRVNLTNMDINITFNTTNPAPVNLSVLGLEKYLTVNVSEELGNNLSYVILKINYTEEELNMSGAVEDSLRIYKFNGTNWTAFDPPGGGVNKTEKYVWANLTSFSDFAVGGKKSSGVACSSSDECSSGNCAADFDGNGMWCAASGNCAANYVITYENGNSLCDGSTLQKCSSGSWTSSSCSAGCSNGACATPSSGGGGGGATSVTVVPVVKKGQTVMVSKLSAYMPATFIFTDLISNITSVIITTTSSFASAATSVNDISVPEIAIDRYVYRYVDIASSIPNTNISRAVINFRVPKSWIEANGLDPSSTVLYRLNVVWSPLQTRLAAEDSESYAYESVTPGFSVFAITGSRATKTVAAVCGNSIVEENEACDGTAQLTCKDFGFANGLLGCSGCKYDTSRCLPEEPLAKEGQGQDDHLFFVRLIGALIVSALALIYIANKRRKRKGKKRKKYKKRKKRPKQKPHGHGFPF